MGLAQRALKLFLQDRAHRVAVRKESKKCRGQARGRLPGFGSSPASPVDPSLFPPYIPTHPTGDAMVESWIAPLEAGDPEAAWDRFIERYRRLIFGAIRHYTTDSDDVMDVFASVCEAFRQNDFARLRRCAAQLDPARPFSTLLVVVVRNLTIDWFRHRDGRQRLS